MLWRRSGKVLIILFSFTVIIYHLVGNMSNGREQLVKLPRKQPRLVKNKPKTKHDQLYDECEKWVNQPRDKKISTMLDNPVYRAFKIPKPKLDYVKKKVNLLLIVSSGPRRFDRRKSIRQTWWSDCKITFGVVPACFFFTDLQRPGDKYFENITQEQQRYGDLHFQSLHGGMEFGIRFLYHMVWAMTYYEFDYFLRVDDDYFFCLQRFMYELPMSPPLREFHWGFTHCVVEMTRPEESIIVFSSDVIETFLLQDPCKIRCHPLADQMIGVWVTDLRVIALFRHDDRIHHAPIVSEVPQLRKMKNICEKYMAVHGAYSEDKLLLWSNRGTSEEFIFASAQERDKRIGNLLINSDECEIPHHFNFLRFEPEWQYEPKHCLYKPVWDTSRHKLIDGVYSGRQEDKHLVEEDVKKFGRKV